MGSTLHVKSGPSSDTPKGKQFSFVPIAPDTTSYTHFSYYNNPTFPNGDCMRHDSIGIMAFWTTLIGISLILLSLSLWVFAFVAAGDACERVARNFFRAVVPEQRFLVIQIMDWMGIKHGKLKVY
tara:strand:- start:7354 stop:7728 length:375 start_codon:yes stop_codon:yes gene_type:complete